MSTITPRRRGLVVALTASVALVVPMSAAQAHTKHFTDAAGDVSAYDYSDPNDLVVTPAPQQTNADITTWSLTHSAGSVTVRVHFTDLARTRRGRLHLTGYLRTDTGVVREWDIKASRGSWRGVRTFVDKQGTRVHCTSGHTVDYRANTVVIKMARSCFGRPTWVRGGLYAAWDASRSVQYLDAGLAAGDGDYGKLSGRVHRG